MFAGHTFLRGPGFDVCDKGVGPRVPRGRLVAAAIFLAALTVAAALALRLATLDAQQCERVPGAFNSGFSAGFDTARCVCPDNKLPPAGACH